MADDDERNLLAEKDFAHDVCVGIAGAGYRQAIGDQDRLIPVQQTARRAFVEVARCDVDVVSARATNSGRRARILMRKHNEQLDVWMLLKRCFGGRLSIVVFENGLCVDDVDFADLLDLGIVQSLLKTGLARNTEP